MEMILRADATMLCIMRFLLGEYFTRPWAFVVVPLDQFLHAGTHVELRLPPQQLTCFADIRPVGKHISWIRWAIIHNCFFADHILDQFDQIIDGDHFMSAEVDDFISYWFQRQD